jgi:hypothetical protein
MCHICNIEHTEDKDFRDDEELWRFLPDLEGQERADALSQLAIGTCKDFAGKTSILLAESANKIYQDLGIPDDSVDYLFTYAAIAENKAYIEDYVGAVDAGIRALPLIDKHGMHETYGRFPWEVLEWMVKAGRHQEARAFLERIIENEYEQVLWNS